MNFYSATHCT